MISALFINRAVVSSAPKHFCVCSHAPSARNCSEIESLASRTSPSTLQLRLAQNDIPCSILSPLRKRRGGEVVTQIVRPQRRSFQLSFACAINLDRNSCNDSSRPILYGTASSICKISGGAQLSCLRR